MKVRFSKGAQSFYDVGDADDESWIRDNIADGWAAVQIVKPEKDCPQCHGNGTILEYHPWGSTVAAEELNCECIENQMLDINDLEFEVDLRNE